MTFFCFVWHFLHRIFDKNRIFADQTDLFPSNIVVVTFTKQPEDSRSAVNDQRHDPGTFGIDLQIVHISDLASGTGVDDFFFAKLL